MTKMHKDTFKYLKSLNSFKYIDMDLITLIEECEKHIKTGCDYKFIHDVRIDEIHKRQELGLVPNELKLRILLLIGD